MNHIITTLKDKHLNDHQTIILNCPTSHVPLHKTNTLIKNNQKKIGENGTQVKK